jgi:hypothetical protein
MAKSTNSLITDTMRKILRQHPEDIEIMCIKIIEKAKDGDSRAFSEIMDRMEGKSQQSIVLKNASLPSEDEIAREVNGEDELPPMQLAEANG